jgi:hypothetical protein
MARIIFYNNNKKEKKREREKESSAIFSEGKTLHNLHFEQRGKVNNWKAAE